MSSYEEMRAENARRTLARRATQRENAASWTPSYEPWRHGGWYVTNLVYPSGAVGCVSRNYTDKMWRIVCQNTGPGVDGDRTFATRNEAAYAELALVLAMPDEVTP